MLQARGLGDAIISTSLVGSIHESWNDAVVDVWASREVAALFGSHPFVHRCYVEPLPIIKRHRFSIRSVLEFIRTTRKLRKNRYDLCVNCIGDARENVLTALVNAKESATVVWEKPHPFVNLIRPGLTSMIDHHLYLPKDCLNIYAIYKSIAEGLGCDRVLGPEWLTKNNDSHLDNSNQGSQRIGIHPLASEESREWPLDRWQYLVERIVGSGFEVLVFGAPAEREKLEGAFSQWAGDPRVSLITRDLMGFRAGLRTLTAFVGLDSFGIHAAYALGISSVMINGSNDSSIWAPPGTKVVGDGGGCEEYPCYNRPRCLGSSLQYRCVRSISVEEVWVALNAVLERARLREQLV